MTDLKQQYYILSELIIKHSVFTSEVLILLRYIDTYSALNIYVKIEKNESIEL